MPPSLTGDSRQEQALVLNGLQMLLLAPLGEHYLAGFGCPLPVTLANQMPLPFQPRIEAECAATWKTGRAASNEEPCSLRCNVASP